MFDAILKIIFTVLIVMFDKANIANINNRLIDSK